MEKIAMETMEKNAGLRACCLHAVLTTPYNFACRHSKSSNYWLFR